MDLSMAIKKHANNWIRRIYIVEYIIFFLVCSVWSGHFSSNTLAMVFHSWRAKSEITDIDCRSGWQNMINDLMLYKLSAVWSERWRAQRTMLVYAHEGTLDKRRTDRNHISLFMEVSFTMQRTENREQRRDKHFRSPVAFYKGWHIFRCAHQHHKNGGKMQTWFTVSKNKTKNNKKWARDFLFARAIM